MFLFSLREAFTSLVRIPLGSILSVFASAVISLLLFSAVWAFQVVDSLIKSSGADVAVTIILSPQASAEQVDAINKELHSNPNVSRVRLVTAKETAASLSAQLGTAGEILNSLGETPFNDSIELMITPGKTSGESIETLSQKIMKIGGVLKIYPAPAQQRAYASMASVLTRGGKIAAALLFLLGLIVIAGVVRLNLLMQKRTLVVTSLVGATPWQLRLPFIFAGGIVSALGVLIAIYPYYFFAAPLSRTLVESLAALGVPANVSPLSAPVVALLSLFLVLTAMLSSFFAIRRVENELT